MAEENEETKKRPLSEVDDDNNGTKIARTEPEEQELKTENASSSTSSSSSSSSSDVPAPETKPRRSRGFSAAPVATAISAETQKHIMNLQNNALSSLLSSMIALPAPITSVGPKEHRELFVGNVMGTGCTDVMLKDFLNDAMRKVGLVTGPEDAIISCRMNQVCLWIPCSSFSLFFSDAFILMF